MGARTVDQAWIFLEEGVDRSCVSGSCRRPDGGAGEGRIGLQYLVGALVKGAVVVVGVVEAETGYCDEFFCLIAFRSFYGCFELGPVFQAVFACKD